MEEWIEEAQPKSREQVDAHFHSTVDGGVAIMEDASGHADCFAHSSPYPDRSSHYPKVHTKAISITECLSPDFCADAEDEAQPHTL